MMFTEEDADEPVEHERVCVGVWCLPALAIYLMGSARVIS